MENTQPACIDGSRRFKCVYASACRFAANKPYAFIVDEMIETAYGVRAAADAGDNRVGQPSFLFLKLRFDFFRNNRLKSLHHFGETDAGPITEPRQ